MGRRDGRRHRVRAVRRGSQASDASALLRVRGERLMARYGRLAELEWRLKALEARVTLLESIAEIGGFPSQEPPEEDERYGDPD